MTISERTLRKWRREALSAEFIYKHDPDDSTNLVEGNKVVVLSERILQLTQELLDRHLLRKWRDEKKKVK